MDAIISSEVHGFTKHDISVFFHRLALMGFDNSISDRNGDECQEDALLLLYLVITNTIWSIYDYSVQEYQQTSLFFIYFILALWGIYEWRTRKMFW